MRSNHPLIFKPDVIFLRTGSGAQCLAEGESGSDLFLMRWPNIASDGDFAAHALRPVVGDERFRYSQPGKDTSQDANGGCGRDPLCWRHFRSLRISVACQQVECSVNGTHERHNTCFNGPAARGH